MILTSFQDTTRKKLDHICHDLAYKSIQWFGTPGGSNYTVIMMIIKQKDYTFNERLARVWGTYCEYQLNYDYILVFKDGLRDSDECIEQLEFCLKHLKSQPDCRYSIINQGDPETDRPIDELSDIDESEEEEEQVE